MNWFGREEQRNSTVQDLSKGSLGGVAGLMDSMDGYKRSQKIGKITNSLVQDLASTMVEGTAENGKVKVVYDCQQRPISCHIDEAYWQESAEKGTSDFTDLANAVAAAMKDAHSKSMEQMEEKMKRFYSDLGLS
jgi:DNA-binding protein YbaB